MNSRRKYRLAIVENDHISQMALTLGEIAKPAENDFEYIYALNEMLDAVLDLKKLESMPFQPNRDDKTSLGIILRYE